MTNRWASFTWPSWNTPTTCICERCIGVERGDVPSTSQSEIQDAEERTYYTKEWHGLEALRARYHYERLFGMNRLLGRSVMPKADAHQREFALPRDRPERESS